MTFKPAIWFPITLALTVINVAPSATPSNGGPVDEGSTTTVSLSGATDPSPADVAAGFCAGTPLRMELAARGDLAEGTKVVAEEMTARLGAGRVTASMTAYVVEARPSPRLPG